MMDCASKTVKAHGPMGLYRGAFPLIIGSSGKQAARWTGYNTAADYFRDEKGKLSIPANMLCGVIAGTSEAMFAVTPIETLKSRVIDDSRRGTNKYSGSLDAIKKIVAADGVGGLYRGLTPTIMKQATNQAVRFRTPRYFKNDLFV
jgi:solute carrier family 25 citrate transporter 1